MRDAQNLESIGIDRFPVGCLVTDGARIIRFVNAYVGAQLDCPCEGLIGLSLDMLLTPASRIFCDSYVYPILLDHGYCNEIALNMAMGSGGRASVVVNACVHGDDPELVLWSFMRADKRDQLQTEVLTARNQLQKQAHALRELASRDELTGLLNRREFKRRKVSMISGAERSGKTVMLLLLDIDRFKLVNDTYGHVVGDDVLRQLGTAFLQMARTHELAGRYGGEEFVFAIEDDTEEAARHFSRRLHAAAASVTGSAAPVTVSIGVACRPPGSKGSLKDIVKAADRALYKAKDLGRNRTMIERDRVVMPFD